MCSFLKVIRIAREAGLECYEGTVLRCSWDDRSGQVASGGLNVSRQIILFIRQV